MSWERSGVSRKVEEEELRREEGSRRVGSIRDGGRDQGVSFFSFLSFLLYSENSVKERWGRRRRKRAEEG